MPPTEMTKKGNGKLATIARIEGAGLLPPAALETIAAVARLSVPVLLIGEHGTGKRQAAQLLHRLAWGEVGTFGSLTASGLNRLADSGSSARSFCEVVGVHAPGTLFIADVARLEAIAQVWFWQALSVRPEQFDSLRLVCASDQELESQVRTGKFRPDLYQFISSLSLRLPALRHRKAEIAALIDYFVADSAARFAAPKPVISPELKNRFLDHSWPGNLDEMETVVKSLVVLGSEQVAQAAMEASSKRSHEKNAAATQVSLKAASRAAVFEAERELILDVMGRTQNRRRAAEQLQISYKALLYKLRQIGWEHPTPAIEEE